MEDAKQRARAATKFAALVRGHLARIEASYEVYDTYQRIQDRDGAWYFYDRVHDTSTWTMPAMVRRLRVAVPQLSFREAAALYGWRIDDDDEVAPQQKAVLVPAPLEQPSVASLPSSISAAPSVSKQPAVAASTAAIPQPPAAVLRDVPLSSLALQLKPASTVSAMQRSHRLSLGSYLRSKWPGPLATSLSPEACSTVPRAADTLRPGDVTVTRLFQGQAAQRMGRVWHLDGTRLCVHVIVHVLLRMERVDEEEDDGEDDEAEAAATPSLTLRTQLFSTRHDGDRRPITFVVGSGQLLPYLEVGVRQIEAGGVGTWSLTAAQLRDWATGQAHAGAAAVSVVHTVEGAVDLRLLPANALLSVRGEVLRVLPAAAAASVEGAQLVKNAMERERRYAAMAKAAAAAEAAAASGT